MNGNRQRYRRPTGCRVQADAAGQRGFAPAEFVIAFVLVALLGIIAIREYRAGDTASDLAKVRHDQYSLAVALEAYYVDNNSYPAVTTNPYDAVDGSDTFDYSRTFRRRSVTNTLQTLTTPVAYITSYPVDPFADRTDATYRAYTTPAGPGWILGSFGPDRDESRGGQLQWNAGTLYGYTSAVEIVYTPINPQPSDTLKGRGGNVVGSVSGAFTYDPTNGTVSDGDIWRVRYDDRLGPTNAVGLFLY